MLIFSDDCYRRLIAHCRSTYPDEGCGVLAGTGERVEAVIPVTNSERSPSSYRFDSVEQLRVMKRVRADGRAWLGVFHSHVASDAYPSATDVRLAWDPELAHVIVSLARFDDPVVRGYRIVEGRIEEIPIQVGGLA